MNFTQAKTILTHLQTGADIQDRGFVQQALEEVVDMIESIHEIMDGKEWSADTTEAIANVLTRSGLYIREPGEDKDDDEDEVWVARKPVTEPPFMKLLDLSTAHIQERTCNGWFHEQQVKEQSETIEGPTGVVFSYIPPVVFYEKGEYGWFVHVSTDWGFSSPEEPLHQDVPEDLKRVLEYAARAGADWIMFDRDGEHNDELPVYDW